jgi:hypothetical protein
MVEMLITKAKEASIAIDYDRIMSAEGAQAGSEEIVKR